jgi:hypothetical protein
MGARHLVVVAVMIVCLGGLATAQDEELPLANWGAPPYWIPTVQPTQGERTTDGGLIARVEGLQAQADAAASSPLPFVAVTPCRIVDTRDPAPDGFHQPNFADDEARTFPFPSSPDCPGLPVTAGAYSINVQFRPLAQLSYLTAYPTGVTMPLVSTLTAGPAAWVGTAAIVPSGTGGAINIYCQYAGRVVIDVNGYYGPGSVVTSLNTLTGDVTLAEGSNIGIYALGNTLTINATGGPGGDLPTGTINQTLRHDGKIWVASSALLNNGTDVAIANNLLLPATGSGGAQGVIELGGNPFVHNYAPPASDGRNTFVGESAGNFTMGGAGAFNGAYNVGVGTEALASTTTGYRNTAVGPDSMHSDTTGHFNTAIGGSSLYSNTSASGNTAVGFMGLYANVIGCCNTASGYYAMEENTIGHNNTAMGYDTMVSNTEGHFNTAVGYNSLLNNTTGTSNIAIGSLAGSNLTTGDRNIDIGNAGVAGEGSTIRIGDGNQSRTFIDGIYGVNLVSQLTRFVTIDENGQLGSQGVTVAAPQAVASGALPATVLKELQKQQETIKALQVQIEELRRQVEKLIRDRTTARP